MQNGKNKWVEDVLGTADHIDRAGAPDMRDSILSRTGGRQIAMTSVIWRIAASVILLVGLNITTIYVYSSYSGSGHQGSSQDTASVFGLGSADGSQVDIGAVFFGN